MLFQNAGDILALRQIIGMHARADTEQFDTDHVAIRRIIDTAVVIEGFAVRIGEIAEANSG